MPKGGQPSVFRYSFVGQVFTLALVGLLLGSCSSTEDTGAGHEPECVRDAQGQPLDSGRPVSVVTDGIVISLGERVSLLEDGALGLHYFPDQGVVVLQREPWLRLLVVAGFYTYLAEGEDFRDLSNARMVLEPGEEGSFDNGYTGIGGVDWYEDGSLYAFYHAEDHEDMPPLPGGLYGFYASVGAAVSQDGGESWEKLGPVVTSPKPKSWTAFEGQASLGAGIPTVVRDPTGEYLYLYYNEFSMTGGQALQVSLARASIAEGPPLPGSFQKYYEGSFSEPGLGGKDTPVLNVWDMNEAGALQPYVVYSAYLERYVMLVDLHYWREDPLFSTEAQPAQSCLNSGLYVTYSEDGIHWARPHRAIIDRTYPHLDKSISWEHGLVWDAGSSSEGWLIYGYSERWGWPTPCVYRVPHYMVGRRIRFELSR